MPTNNLVDKMSNENAFIDDPTKLLDYKMTILQIDLRQNE
jgi:hypothetical protein